jgi:hypothetical protein
VFRVVFISITLLEEKKILKDIENYLKNKRVIEGNTKIVKIKSEKKIARGLFKLPRPVQHEGSHPNPTLGT